MSALFPPGLGAALGAGPVAPPAPPHPSGPALESSINSLHQALAEHPDPQAKTEIAQALQILLRIQGRDMSAAAQPPNPVQAALGR